MRSFEAMCRMVETNVGIVPQSAALLHKQTMQLSMTELNDQWSVHERSMVVQSLDSLPLYARELVEFIRQQTAQVLPVPMEEEAV